MRDFIFIIQFKIIFKTYIPACKMRKERLIRD